jgi:molybdenum cofactor biosynthesis enzyme
MLKSADKAMTMSGIRLVEKSGGRSGNFRARSGKLRAEPGSKR